MKTTYLRVLLALVGLAGFGVSAKAQAVDQVVVNIPFEFSVAGKTLPAGTYRVNRLSDVDVRELIITGVENRASAIIGSSYSEGASGENPHLTFEKVGDQHFLSKIETADHVFAVPVSRQAELVAASKSQGGAASGSTSGSN